MCAYDGVSTNMHRIEKKINFVRFLYKSILPIKICLPSVPRYAIPPTTRNPYPSSYIVLFVERFSELDFLHSTFCRAVGLCQHAAITEGEEFFCDWLTKQRPGWH